MAGGELLGGRAEEMGMQDRLLDAGFGEGAVLEAANAAGVIE